MNDSDAVAALERLGLSNYEARTFLALQRLGVGTASDVSRVADLPQSRVYGVAEALAERGLVEVQRSSPKRYRPVPLEAAEAALRGEVDAAAERAFEYLEAVRGEVDAGDERREDVWTVHGAGTVDDRVRTLVSGATDRVIYGAARAEHLPPGVVDALADRADAGVAVTVMCPDPAAADRLPSDVSVVDTSGGTPAPADGLRILLVDHDTVLMTVREGETETGVWTDGTAMGRMLVGSMDAAMAPYLD